MDRHYRQVHDFAGTALATDPPIYPQGNPLFIENYHVLVDELNDRLASRQFPDSGLAPMLEIRPVSTKYSFFPISDARVEPSTRRTPLPDYYLETNFNPGTLRAPVAGFLRDIDVYSDLRGQSRNTVLVRGGTSHTYIPSQNSDLYKVEMATPVFRPEESQPYPDLFRRQQFSNQSTPRPFIDGTIGQDLFMNNTRTQLRTATTSMH